MIDPLGLLPSDLEAIKSGNFDKKAHLDGIAYMMKVVRKDSGAMSDAVYCAARKLSTAGLWKHIDIVELANALKSNKELRSDFVAGLPQEIRGAVMAASRKQPINRKATRKAEPKVGISRSKLRSFNLNPGLFVKILSGKDDDVFRRVVEQRKKIKENNDAKRKLKDKKTVDRNSPLSRET